MNAAYRYWDLIFIVKYNSSGVAQWMTQAGNSTINESGNGIDVDNSGNVYVTGQIEGSVTNPSYFGNTGLVPNGGSDYFLAKYNPSNSTWEWAVSGGGTGDDYGVKVSLFSYGNPYVNGYLNSQTATFGATSISETGGTGGFVAKYSTDGNLTWIHPEGAYGQYGWTSSKVSANGNLYLGSAFSGTTIVGTQTISSSGGSYYLASWNSDGIFQWVKQIAGNNGINAIDFETNGNIDLAATVAGTETFDCTVLNSLTYSNLAVAKFGSSNLTSDVPTITTSASNICSSANTTLSISSGNLNNATGWKWYIGSCGGTPVGSGTSITVSPTQNTTYYARGEGGCAGAGPCGSIAITINDAPPVITCPGVNTG